MLQAMIMTMFGGTMIGLGILLLCGGIKAYLSVMTLPL